MDFKTHAFRHLTEKPMNDEATVPRPTMTRQRTDVVPTLTVIAHPNPERVPSQLKIRATVQISRTAPSFTSVATGLPRPLGDRYISRSPITVKPEDDAVWILPGEGRIEVVADGKPLTEPTRFEHADIERGVVLTLHGRVALLLHHAPAKNTPVVDKLGLEGCSAEIERVRQDIRIVGDLNVPVLIRGESGTGKELIARAIHSESPRAEGPYEALNMATLSASLAASELFGHVRGAFTGADRNHTGCFVRCDGGTLFIGETPIDTQAQLLRVLETHDIRPVGGSSSKTVDVRVIAATDADLEGAVRQGTFREALLQRLAGFRIMVPALRERRVDIGPLIYHFARIELESVGMAHLLDPADTEQPWISATTVARLSAYHWPGNVRELRNVVRQLVIAGRYHPEMSLGSDFDALLRSSAPVKVMKVGRQPDSDGLETLDPRASSPARSNYRSPSDVSEDELIETLRAKAYRLAPTAKALNLSRTSLYSLVEQSSRIRKAADIDGEEITAALEAAGDKLAEAAMALEVSAHALKLRMRALGMVE
jgi:two-component system nitrogen regulation response regulator GlnG